MRQRGVPYALAVLLAMGCGGGGQNLKAESRSLKSKVSQLRVQARRDRRTIRDLENKVFLLEDRLETARLELDRAGPPVELPVEVVEPDRNAVGTDERSAGVGRGTRGSSDAGDGQPYEVVGVDDDGNEIIYVGEAAKDRSVRPSIKLYENGGSAERGRFPGGDSRSQSLDPVPLAADRIPMTDGAVPTVSAQLRERRQSRNASAGDDDAAREAYKRYYAALRAGHHAHAVTGFRSFLAEFPHHDYADNAQYWLGEAYYDQRQYERALREFRAVVDNYPRGNKVPDALLKAGYCYAALGRTAKARAVLDQVAAIYPKSGPAKLAARRLAELKKEQE